MDASWSLVSAHQRANCTEFFIEKHGCESAVLAIAAVVSYEKLSVTLRDDIVVLALSIDEGCPEEACGGHQGEKNRFHHTLAVCLDVLFTQLEKP